MSLRAYLFTFILLSTPVLGEEESGFAVSAGEIRIQEEESPAAAHHGILPTMGRVDSFSWAGSEPDRLISLLKEFQQPLAWDTARDAAVTALSSPILPDAESSVPQNWLLMRLETLRRIGEYEAAWNLHRTLNTSLLSEPVARIGTDLGWATRRISRACRLTASITENENTKFESGDSRLYWLVHYVICQQLAGKKAEAEVSLALLQESVPKKLPPLLTSLMQGWGTRDMLPPLSEKDALIYPALAALLTNPVESGAPLAERIPANFISHKLAASLPPELQAALAHVPTLPPILRAAMAETALRYHFIEGARMGQFYQAAAQLPQPPKDQGLRSTYDRALLYADAQSTRSRDLQSQATAQALSSYHGVFSPRAARAILGKNLRQLYAEDRQLPLPLSYETMALYLDRGDREEARDVARSLNYREDVASEQAASIAGRILKLTGDESGYAGDSIIIPEFGQTPEPEVIWLTVRFGRLMEAQGYRVQWPARSLEAAAPPANITYASPTRLNGLHLARLSDSPAEQVLRAALLIADTPPQRTSDQALLRVLETLNTLDLRALANALMVEALLGIPDARMP